MLNLAHRFHFWCGAMHRMHTRRRGTTTVKMATSVALVHTMHKQQNKYKHV
jgi:hypothetical protein